MKKDFSPQFLPFHSKIIGREFNSSAQPFIGDPNEFPPQHYRNIVHYKWKLVLKVLEAGMITHIMNIYLCGTHIIDIPQLLYFCPSSSLSSFLFSFLGYNVLLSDSDVVWLRNPFLLFETMPSCDFYFYCSKNVLPRELTHCFHLNTGLFFFFFFPLDIKI